MSLSVGRRPAGAGTRPSFDLEAIFRRLDRNSDCKLSGDGIPEAHCENLMRLGADEDGSIAKHRRR
jgi:hypothetical protein